MEPVFFNLMVGHYMSGLFGPSLQVRRFIYPELIGPGQDCF